MKTNTNDMQLLQKEIEVRKKQLNELLVRKSYKVIDDDIIEISQTLDKLLVEYISKSFKKGITLKLEPDA